MQLMHNIAVLTEIDQPRPTSKTCLADMFGYIVFLYPIGIHYAHVNKTIGGFL